MIQRAIPSSGELLPVIGLGTWIQFDVGTRQEERQPLKEVLQLLAEKGGKLIDSSPMYGRSEQVIGELTSESTFKDHYFYATKVWTTGREQGIQQMEASLRKMKRKTLDLIQVHNLVDYQTHLKTLNSWKEEGKVRYTGITHYTATAHNQLEQVLQSYKVDFLQVNYSIRVRNAEQRLLPAALDKGVAVIINEPLERGTLFKAVKGKTLPSWAREYNINSWSQFFLKYIISHPAVTCVIAGTSNPNNMLDNLQGGEGELPDEKMRKKMVEFMENL